MKYPGIDHLRSENAVFVEFHNTHHRYSAHAGCTPNQMWTNRLHAQLPAGSPRKDGSKSRYIRSNRELNLFGKRLTLAENNIHQYVTAIIKVRSRKLIVVDINGEIIHDSDFNLSRELR